MKKILLLLFSGMIFCQPRIGEMRALTSTLEVRELAYLGDKILLGTGGGLTTYDTKSQLYIIFTRDHGLIDTDINTVHVGPMENIWIGSNMGIQVWDPLKQLIVNWFQLDIEEVSGFTNYKNMIYSSVRQNGKWGIMEFIYSNEKIYYRDFYHRDDINDILKIVSFEENIILHTDQGLIAGNPHKEHPIYWTNPFSNITGEIQAINTNNNSLAIISSDAIYSIKVGGTSEALLQDNIYLSSINYVEIQGDQDFFAISDSVLFDIGTDKLEKIYSNSDLKFSSIINYNSQIWLGSELGFGYFNNSKFEHIVNNEPYVASPDAIYYRKNKVFMADEKGLSLSGWSNLSVNPYLKDQYDDLHMKTINIDLGIYISEKISLDSLMYLSLFNSSTSGIASFDISSDIKLNNLLITNKEMTKNGFHFVVPDIAIDKKRNLWAISNNNKMKPLIVFNNDISRNISVEESGYILSNESNKISVDNFNRIWILSPSGLVMYKYTGDIMNPDKEIWVEVDIDPGITTRIPFDINVSPRNRLWILTSIGLIHKDLQVSETNPVINTGPLGSQGNLYPYFPSIPFNDYSRIRFDPRGNVWVTTQSTGVYILTEDGDYWPNVNGLNSSNSNLLSNNVNDISFDSKQGLAYIATDKGVSIVRIPFADKKISYKSVEIFPSPFVIPNMKPLTINGLKDDSSIKIMSLNGLVFRSINKSDIKGYQAFWDGRDDEGNLVGSGIYLIAIYANKASLIEKVAVIRE